MIRYRNLPLKRKLMLIGLLTNGVAVVLLSIIFGVGEWLDQRSRAVTTLAVHAGIIADNAAPALIFSDEIAAHEVLARLGVETNIVYAVVQDKAGSALAQFHRVGRKRTPPSLPAADQHLFFADQLVYAKKIVRGGDTVGMLYLQSDLQSLYWAMWRKLLLIVGAMTAALALALFLFTRLQKSISDPIHNLVAAMTHVTRQSDYSVRATVPGADEFGVLAQGFNTMLDAIREREAVLASYRAGLEEAVKQRTEELKQLNASLEWRVQDEVAKNREKDHLLIQQSRLAAIGEMIGNIAHQWRQPINALTLLLANIKDAYEFKELDQASLDKAVDDGQAIIQRMSTTIDDFRNFFRPNKEKICFSVNAVVADVLRILDAAFRNSDIAIVVSGDAEVMAYGFRNEYSQVLINLLANAKDALQHTRTADARVAIRISRRRDRAEVRIEDNAGGIASDVLPRIFDPYFTTKSNGTGIGLYMSKMIIENGMDGRIEASNSAGGACFVVLTPSCAAAPPA